VVGVSVEELVVKELGAWEVREVRVKGQQEGYFPLTITSNRGLYATG
jgi:hypothetical protein